MPTLASVPTVEPVPTLAPVAAGSLLNDRVDGMAALDDGWVAVVAEETLLFTDAFMGGTTWLLWTIGGATMFVDSCCALPGGRLAVVAAQCQQAYIVQRQDGALKTTVAATGPSRRVNSWFVKVQHVATVRNPDDGSIVETILILGTDCGELEKWIVHPCGKVLRAETWASGAAASMGNEVTALWASPDGAKLACGRRDGSVHIWNMGTTPPSLVQTLHGEWTSSRGSKRWARSIEWLPSGVLATITDSDNNLTLWRPTGTGDLAKDPAFDHRGSDVSCVKELRDGRLVVIVSGCKQANPLQRPRSSTFSYDEFKRRHSHEIRVFDSATGAFEAWAGAGHAFMSVAGVMPDGSLATGSGDGSMALWRLPAAAGAGATLATPTVTAAFAGLSPDAPSRVVAECKTKYRYGPGGPWEFDYKATLTVSCKCVCTHSFAASGAGSDDTDAPYKCAFGTCALPLGTFAAGPTSGGAGCTV